MTLGQRAARRTHALQARIYAEFKEMPGLSLTLSQAAKLFGASEHTCADVLASLVERRLLRTSPDGRCRLEGSS